MYNMSQKSLGRAHESPARKMLSMAWIANSLELLRHCFRGLCIAFECRFRCRERVVVDYRSVVRHMSSRPHRRLQYPGLSHPTTTSLALSPPQHTHYEVLYQISMTSGLPSHRQLFSSLITAVCEPPPPSSSSPPSHNPSLQASIPPSRRQFLLTLHVLFPTLLLPALDLLDRELITRLTLEGSSAGSRAKHQVYIVKSLASTLKGAQRRAAGPSGAKVDVKYAVRLGAWNCTCAGFALDAYGGSKRTPVTTSSSLTAVPTSAEVEVESLYGGYSLDGTGRGEADVPCCKHILACLLAENWGSVLGGRVEAKAVTREEMAGVIASI